MLNFIVKMKFSIFKVEPKPNVMKKATILLVVAAIPLFSPGQDVFITSLEVNKGYPLSVSDQSLSFELATLTDVSSFTHKLDKTKSVYTKIMDDTGFDLLAAEMDWEELNKSWIDENNRLMIAYREPISGGENPGIIVRSMLRVAPNAGAKTINIQGVIAMINVAESEQTYTLKDIPGQFEWGAPGVKTVIGEVKISKSGSLSVEDGVSFTKYQVVSDKPIVSVTITGGDDREEAAKYFELGLYGNELVFKKIPEKLDLIVVAKDTEIKEIPFDITLSIGF